MWLLHSRTGQRSVRFQRDNPGAWSMWRRLSWASAMRKRWQIPGKHSLSFRKLSILISAVRNLITNTIGDVPVQKDSYKYWKSTNRVSSKEVLISILERHLSPTSTSKTIFILALWFNLRNPQTSDLWNFVLTHNEIPHFLSFSKMRSNFADVLSKSCHANGK